MRLIQIFLGSSCLLKTQRELIGDEIRKMSAQWECKGIRIRLNCWEDFAPEYMGISKQKEYNGFLVKPSQIFIALIGNRIGYYTNREIETAIKEISKDNIHCICMPEKATAEEYHNSSKEFSLKDGRIYFIGSYLANVTGLKDCNSLIQLENELKSVNEQMLQPDAKRFDLWNKQTSLKAQITQKLLMALNEFLLSDRYSSDCNVSDDIDYSLAVEACYNEDDIYKSCSQLNIQQKQKRINHIINRIEYIRKGNERNSIKDEIGKALNALYANVSSLSELSLESPDELIQTMCYMVTLSDTYGIRRMQEFDEDNLYGLIIKTADKYERLSPSFETMRINYANSFSRKLNHSMANKLYLQAVDNMNKFDDSTIYIRRRICGAYTFAIEHLMEVDIHTESVYQLFAAYHDKLTKWSKAGEAFYIGECMYWASKLKCLLPEDDSMELINNAERAYDNVLQYSPLSPEDSAYSDVYCYLPNSIAAYYIDNFRDEELQSGMPAFEKAVKYSEIEINNAIRLTKVDEIHGKGFVAKVKHQLGFLFTKQNNLYLWGKVLPLYEEAYKIRKEIYNTTLQPSDELEVAETATNIGGFICLILGNIEFVKSTPLWNEIKEYILRNKYSFADEAVDIYSRHITRGESEKELNYYKALQLKGSLLYVCAEKQIPDGNKDEGLKLMKQAYEWNIQHPLNNYKDVFESISGNILRMEQLGQNKIYY